jgi:hypothetical protein
LIDAEGPKVRRTLIQIPNDIWLPEPGENTL